MCSSEHYFSGTSQRRPVNGCLRDPRGMSGIDRFTEMPLWRPLLELVSYSLDKGCGKKRYCCYISSPLKLNLTLDDSYPLLSL
ncbi:hypothetical protein J1N35_031281 [Gossypium stocksii]|uniref:Uncharacterized protein n=1 Tax=Gossypium stocksii TaxID=47602 RepID=A0A9D3ZVI5_9ROSI|nr:hypothetical protein J1N35_031281 [Gossypium stocksii]